MAVPCLRATACLIAACLGVAAPFALAHGEAAAKWTQLQSENFLFIGDASEGQIRRVAQRLEQFRDAMLRVLPNASAQSRVPTIVLAFDSDDSLTPAKPLFRGKPVEVAGYFQAGEDANYIAVNAEDLDVATPAIFHEYAHFLINETQGPVPPWVNEGLAELYQVTDQQDGGKTVTIGRSPKEHFDLLRRSTLMPVKELIAVDYSSPVYHEGSRRGVFYAQSWALVHYLTLGNEARAAQFRNYLSAMQSGKPYQDAFASAFGGSAGALDRELSEYVRQIAFPYIRFRFAEQSAAASVPRGTALDEDEAEAYLADLQSRIGRVDEARVRLTAIHKRNPKVARSLMVLGTIAAREKQWNEAVANLEQAAALAPDDFAIQNAYGRSLVSQMSELRNTPGAAARILPQARAALERAAALNPRSARTAYLLGYVLLVGGGEVPVAIASLERAIQIEPRTDYYRMLLAQALARQGDYERATSLLGPLVGAGRTAETRNDARRVLGYVADMRVALAKGAAAPPIVTPVDAGAPPDPRSNAAALSGLMLRAVQPGEQRVLGTLDAVDCGNGAVILRVTSNGRSLALRARQFADVDFISYRSNQPGQVNCGPQASRDRAYITYRPEPADGSDGVAVAVELLPDDFVPPNPQR